MTTTGLSLDLNFEGPTIPKRNSGGVSRSPGFIHTPPPESSPSVSPSVTISQYKQFQELYTSPLNTSQTTSDIYFSQQIYSQPQSDPPSAPDINSRAAQLPKKLKYLESQCEIDFDQLEFKRKLGEGAFGEVWHGTLWDLDVAIKRLKGNFLRASPLEELADEVAMLKSLRHPNCVLFLGFTTPPNFCIITEYLSLGSLRSILDNPMIRLNSKLIVKIAFQVACGMNYLHTQSPAIYHRDLNSHNILCHKNWIIKVADYGLSQTKNSSMEFCGAIPWQAPEVKSGLFLPESDVFSFGVVLWELVTRKVPWKGVNMQKVAQLVREGKRPEIPDDCPGFLSELIQRCWNQVALERPSFHEIIEFLKPYEKVKRTPASVKIDEKASMELQLQEYEDLMMFGDPNAIVCRCWETVLDPTTADTSLEFISNISNSLLTLSNGSMCFMDSMGKMLWIVGFPSRDALAREEKFLKEKQREIDNFLMNLVSPITRQIMKLTPFCLRPGATHAVATKIRIQEGLGTESLKLFKQHSMKILEELKVNWCGTIILMNCESTFVTIITLLDCPTALETLESRGYLQKQMKAFQNLMADIPVFTRFKVKYNDHFKSISPLETLDSTYSPNTSVQSLLEVGFGICEDKKIDFSKEPVLDSFFCLLVVGTEKSVGHLFVCAEYLRFKGRKNLGKSGERVVSLHFRELVSMDENRPFGRAGHTLQLVTCNGTVLTLKSLLQRGCLIRLIQKQLDKLDPPHHIIHLLNGEPY